MYKPRMCYFVLHTMFFHKTETCMPYTNFTSNLCQNSEISKKMTFCLFFRGRKYIYSVPILFYTTFNVQEHVLRACIDTSVAQFAVCPTTATMPQIHVHVHTFTCIFIQSRVLFFCLNACGGTFFRRRTLCSPNKEQESFQIHVQAFQMRHLLVFNI